MPYALHRGEKIISILDKDTNQEGKYDSITGKLIRGDDLGFPPDEVLYMAWRQTQKPGFKEGHLRKTWAKIRASQRETGNHEESLYS